MKSIRPYQLADTGEWTMNIHIFHHRGDETSSRQFSANNCFNTREEAVAHCFNFGKQIVDGKSENCTVDGL
ncbi:MAG: CV_2116 domain-containing protein [Gammaproteobacteria bacterium]